MRYIKDKCSSMIMNLKQSVRSGLCITHTQTKWHKWRWGWWAVGWRILKKPKFMPVDRDFIFLLNAYDIDPSSYTPKINTMLDFNLWTWNSRAFPSIDSWVVRKNDRVRIRVGHLTMTDQPIHLHGHVFHVTGTDGGWIPPTARWLEVTTDIGVGQRAKWRRWCQCQCHFQKTPCRWWQEKASLEMWIWGDVFNVKNTRRIGAKWL